MYDLSRKRRVKVNQFNPFHPAEGGPPKFVTVGGWQKKIRKQLPVLKGKEGSAMEGFRKIGLSCEGEIPEGTQRSLYTQWTDAYNWEAGGFNSTGLWAEVVVAQAFNATAHLPSPCPLRTAVCCFLLTKICNSFGTLRPILNIIINEIFNALYVEHSVDLAKPFRGGAAGNGSAQTTPSLEHLPSPQPSFMSFTPYTTQLNTCKNDSKQLRKALEDVDRPHQDVTAILALQDEIVDLRRMLVSCYFKAWKKETTQQSSNIVGVMQAAKNRNVLGKCFRRWRRTVRYNKTIEETKRMKRLGIKQVVNDSSESEPDSPTSKDDLPQVCIVNVSGALDGSKWIGATGELSKTSSNKAIVKFPTGDIVCFPITCVEYILKENLQTSDLLMEATDDFYSAIEPGFLLTWINNELQTIETSTKINQRSIATFSELRSCEAFTAVTLFMTDGADEIESVPMWSPMERAGRLKDILPDGFACWVDPSFLTSANEAFLILFILALFGHWVAVTGEKCTPVLIKLLEFKPSPSELVDRVSRLVWGHVKDTPEHCIKYQRKTNIDEFRMALLTSCVRDKIKPLQNDVFSLFASVTGSIDSDMHISMFCIHLERIGVVPKLLCREDAHLAFYYSQGPATSDGAVEDDNTLDAYEYFDALCNLLLWARPTALQPTSPRSPVGNTALAQDIYLFLSTVFFKASVQ